MTAAKFFCQFLCNLFSLPIVFTSKLYFFFFFCKINGYWITMSYLNLFSASLVDWLFWQNVKYFVFLFTHLFRDFWWNKCKQLQSLNLCQWSILPYHLLFPTKSFSNFLTPLPGRVPGCMFPFLRCNIWDFILAYVFDFDEWFHLKLFKVVGLIIKHYGSK